MDQPDGRNHAGQLGLPAEAALAEHAAQLRLDVLGDKPSTLAASGMLRPEEIASATLASAGVRP